MSQKAIDIAAQLKARLTLPTDPTAPRSMYAKTNVRETWNRWGPDDDFFAPTKRERAQMEGRGTQ
jgi:hypothetical protein